MLDITNLLTARTITVLFSTISSLIIIMLVVGIITVDDVVNILGLSEASENAFRLIVERIREVAGNLLNILSQLLSKLFSWAGLEVDLGRVDLNGDS